MMGSSQRDVDRAVKAQCLQYGKALIVVHGEVGVGFRPHVGDKRCPLAPGR